jgi:hypothetical protein
LTANCRAGEQHGEYQFQIVVLVFRYVRRRSYATIAQHVEALKLEASVSLLITFIDS